MKRRPKGEPLPPVARFQNDSQGRQRRLCDVITTGSYGGPCSHYMHREIDGRAICQWHDPERNVGRLMCEHTRDVETEKGPVPTRCGFRARWFADGRWWCTTHDPKKYRCENVKAHPAEPEAVRQLGAEILGAGVAISPTSPTAVAKFNRGAAVHWLCSECARGLRPVEDPFAIPRSVKVPCCLCGGTCCLYDNEDRPFPCVCTPGGRALVNGAPDEVVLRRIEAE